MSEIEPPLNVVVWGTDRQLTFSSTDDVVSWAKEEKEFWTSINRPRFGRLPKYFDQSINHWSAIETAALAGSGDLQSAIQPVASGTLLTRDHPAAAVIKSLTLSDPDAAGLLWVASRSDASGLLNSIGLPSPNEIVLRLIATLIRTSQVATTAQLELFQSEFDRLKSEAGRALGALRENSQAQGREFQELTERFDRSFEEKREGWEGQILLVKEEWAALKKVYDTELGLRAPTSYWTERSSSHRNQAIGFSISFGLAVICMVALFVLYGMPFLTNAAGDRATVALVLPVLIPAFAAVWVLKILGRLLSESLHLMRDADERQTLVKTFLALMKDEMTGKSVVKDEDRILILHALFRSSTTSAADDAPPVHWFDVLASKIGSKQR